MSYLINMFCFNNQNISIIFSQKSDGDMLFKSQHTELNEQIRQNRISFFEKNKVDPSRLVNLVGVHGTHIAMTRHSDLGKGAFDSDTRIPDTDGLITNIKNSYLMITGADCFPVFFWDPINNAIGAAHCGWRGILNELPAKMISRFIGDFGSNPKDIEVWIGPGIKSCHFSKSKDVVELFKEKYNVYIGTRDEQYESGRFIDLAGIIKSQLIKASINPQKITVHPDCTYCQKDKYFSHRRDKNKIIEANAFIIHLK